MAALATIIVVDDSESDCEMLVEEAARDFMGHYSPPRIVLACIALGCNAKLPYDATTSGHDFLMCADRATGFRARDARKPKMTMLPPPCAMRSPMQVLCRVRW